MLHISKFQSLYRVWLTKTRYHAKKDTRIQGAVQHETTSLPSGTRRETRRWEKIVYVDECGFRAESYRRHGYAPKGECVLGLISGTRTRTTTLVAARIESTFMAPGLFDGSCDAACFNAWRETYLCLRLSALDVVVLDNAKIHKTYRMRELIEASGAEVLFLPPYSPDYNPIEHDFANIKRLREYNSDKTIDEVINMYH